jgi:hypothetical protein
MSLVERKVAIEGGSDDRALLLERRDQRVAICEAHPTR